MTESWVAAQLERYRRDGLGLLAVVESLTGQLIGDCGPTVQWVRDEAHIELGWHIRADRQSQGFAREAGAACRDEAWRQGLDHLICIVRPENVPSWRVARALRFRPWTADIRAGMAHVVWRIERNDPPAPEHAGNGGR